MCENTELLNIHVIYTLTSENINACFEMCIKFLVTHHDNNNDHYLYLRK